MRERVVRLQVRAHTLTPAHPQDLQQIGVAVGGRGVRTRGGHGVLGVHVVRHRFGRGGAGDQVPGLRLGQGAGPGVLGFEVASGRAERPERRRLLAGGQTPRTGHGEPGGHGPAGLVLAPRVPLEARLVHAQLGEPVRGELAERRGAAVLDEVRVEVGPADPDLDGAGLPGDPVALGQDGVTVGADARERVPALPGHLLHGGARTDALLDLPGGEGHGLLGRGGLDGLLVGQRRRGRSVRGRVVGHGPRVDPRGEREVLVRPGRAGGRLGSPLVLLRGIVGLRRRVHRSLGVLVVRPGDVHLRHVVPGRGAVLGRSPVLGRGALDDQPAQIGGEGERVLLALGPRQAQRVAVLGGSGQSQLCHGGGPSHIVFWSPGMRTPGRACPDPSRRAADHGPGEGRAAAGIRPGRACPSTFGTGSAMVHNLRATAQAGDAWSAHDAVRAVPAPVPVPSPTSGA